MIQYSTTGSIHFLNVKTQTNTLINLCTENYLTWISSVYSIDFNYESDANGAQSTIDQFAMSDSLINCVNK